MSGLIRKFEAVEVVAVLTRRDHRTLGHGATLGHPRRHRDPVVVGEVGVTGDDRVDVVVDAVDDLAEVGRRVDGRGQRRGGRTLVDEQDDDVGTLRLERRRPPRWSPSTMSVTSISRDPAGETSSGRCSVTAPTKPTWTSPKSLIQVSFRARAVGALEPDVGAEVLPVGPAVGVVVDVVGRHHPVDQVVVALVELVVAHRRHLEAGRVERVDRRLVLLDERLERRRADQVTRRREHGARSSATEVVDRAGDHRGTRLGAASGCG